MGSFWIFFLFIGIVALVKRKELASNDDTSTASAPTDAEKSEIERRIKEIFGEVESSQKTSSAPTTSPAMSRPRPATTPIQTPKKVNEARPLSAYTSSSRAKAPITQQQAIKPQQGSKLYQSTSTPSNAPKTAESHSELERMIDDFTLEKAVIYAEILEPKFKEY